MGVLSPRSSAAGAVVGLGHQEQEFNLVGRLHSCLVLVPLIGAIRGGPAGMRFAISANRKASCHG
jgi:hypothetical protein